MGGGGGGEETGSEKKLPSIAIQHKLKRIHKTGEKRGGEGAEGRGKRRTKK